MINLYIVEVRGIKSWILNINGNKVSYSYSKDYLPNDDEKNHEHVLSMYKENYDKLSNTDKESFLDEIVNSWTDDLLNKKSPPLGIANWVSKRYEELKAMKLISSFHSRESMEDKLLRLQEKCESQEAEINKLKTTRSNGAQLKPITTMMSKFWARMSSNKEINDSAKIEFLSILTGFSHESIRNVLNGKIDLTKRQHGKDIERINKVLPEFGIKRPIELDIDI